MTHIPLWNIEMTALLFECLHLCVCLCIFIWLHSGGVISSSCCGLIVPFPGHIHLWFVIYNYLILFLSVVHSSQMQSTLNIPHNKNFL